MSLFIAPIWAAIIVILVIGLAWLLRKPLTRVVRDLRITRVSILGIDVEWIIDQTQAAYREKHLDPASPGDLRAFAVLSAHLAPLLSDRRVLWVDDNPANNRAEGRLLRNLGVDVENAVTSAEALDYLERNAVRFDIVISDWVRRGREEGPELLEQIRAAGSGIPVIYYVGEATAQRRATAAELGAVAVTDVPDDLLRFALLELSTAR